MSVFEKIRPEVGAGGFTRNDGTVQFFSRVNALVTKDMTLLDFGAGRGVLGEHRVPYIREISNFRGRVAKVVGIDVDPIVTTNPTVDEGLQFDGAHIPAADESFDLIFSDHVFEHLPDPQQTASELFRVLKPGGWICARTPHLYSILTVGSKLVPNSNHAKMLSKIKPSGRQGIDVFPTHYRLNSMRALSHYFPAATWNNFSYTWSPEPSYNFGSILLTRVLSAVQYVKKPIMGGEVLLVFVQKKA